MLYSQLPFPKELLNANQKQQGKQVKPKSQHKGYDRMNMLKLLRLKMHIKEGKRKGKQLAMIQALHPLN
jgi:hypothetical protein